MGIYAWALLPNHLHLLVRTGARPLAHSMRSLLTGYAGAFNRRHKRGGHLCQNRYKSIVVEEAPYVLELVRYLHLNPLRAHVVPTLRSLERYPCTGHSALLGALPRPWQATATIQLTPPLWTGGTPEQAKVSGTVNVNTGAVSLTIAEEMLGAPVKTFTGTLNADSTRLTGSLSGVEQLTCVRQ